MTNPKLHPAYVVDTSVAVKWYVQRGEADVAKAFQLLDVYGGDHCTLRAPELLLWEISNALTIGHRLRPAEVLAALTHLRELQLDLNTLHWSTLQSAVQIAAATDTAVYDAYYLALALESGSVLVTADERFLRKTRSYHGIVSLSQLQLDDLIS